MKKLSKSKRKKLKETMEKETARRLKLGLPEPGPQKVICTHYYVKSALSEEDAKTLANRIISSGPPLPIPKELLGGNDKFQPSRTGCSRLRKKRDGMYICKKCKNVFNEYENENIRRLADLVASNPDYNPSDSEYYVEPATYYKFAGKIVEMKNGENK